jgi:hypothetical protein
VKNGINGQPSAQIGQEVVTARASRTLSERSEAAKAADMVAQIRDHLAREDDAAANARDATATIRDDEAVHREQSDAGHPATGELLESAASDRTGSVKDRGRARHDREAAHEDRKRASDDRDAATAALAGHDKEYDRLEMHADDMLLVGQAQGVLMQARGIGAAEALLEIFTRASDDNTGLRVAAQNIISDVIDNALDSG